MARRYSKWFTISPSGATTGIASATYNGKDSDGNRDPIGEGSVGTTYTVTMYSKFKLEAPNPPFHTDEGFVVSKVQVQTTIQRYLSRFKPKPPE